MASFRVRIHRRSFRSRKLAFKDRDALKAFSRLYDCLLPEHDPTVWPALSLFNLFLIVFGLLGLRQAVRTLIGTQPPFTLDPEGLGPRQDDGCLNKPKKHSVACVSIIPRRRGPSFEENGVISARGAFFPQVTMAETAYASSVCAFRY